MVFYSFSAVFPGCILPRLCLTPLLAPTKLDTWILGRVGERGAFERGKMQRRKEWESRVPGQA